MARNPGVLVTKLVRVHSVPFGCCHDRRAPLRTVNPTQVRCPGCGARYTLCVIENIVHWSLPLEREGL